VFRNTRDEAGILRFLVERREVQGDHGLVQSASATRFVVLGAKAENAPVWFPIFHLVLPTLAEGQVSSWSVAAWDVSGFRVLEELGVRSVLGRLVPASVANGHLPCCAECMLCCGLIEMCVMAGLQKILSCRL
jgi:hypothetical protein